MIAVALVLLLSAAVRLYHLGTPAEYMFDEVYYAKDAKAIVDGRVGPSAPYRWEAGDEVSWPHPEMGKFAIAGGILLLGDRAWGWRLPAVAAGMLTLACVYPLARRLRLARPWALLALLLAAADPLGMAQSRIATLDVFVGAWTVLCVLLALRYVQTGHRLAWLAACGAAGGMALATKWSGALALLAAALVLVAAWLHARRRTPGRTAHAAAGAGHASPSRPEVSARPLPPEAHLPHRGDLAWTLALARAALCLALLPAAVYLLSYAQYFATGHTPADWWELHRQMVHFNWTLEAGHSYASAAPTWIIDYRPVWYYFSGETEYRGVVAIGNPFLWWTATLCLLAAPLLALRRRTTLLLPAAGLVAALYLPWFATSRTSFLYYMTPVAPPPAAPAPPPPSCPSLTPRRRATAPPRRPPRTSRRRPPAPGSRRPSPPSPPRCSGCRSAWPPSGSSGTCRARWPACWAGSAWASA